jgi:hypothetical protein
MIEIDGRGVTSAVPCVPHVPVASKPSQSADFSMICMSSASKEWTSEDGDSPQVRVMVPFPGGRGLGGWLRRRFESPAP